ncbi:MAG: hypothetical protein ACFUZC_22430 [Chthoniobacteraceae bacterium]
MSAARIITARMSAARRVSGPKFNGLALATSARIFNARVPNRPLIISGQAITVKMIPARRSPCRGSLRDPSVPSS